MGTILGSYIERLVGVGNIVVRVFCPANSPSVAETLRDKGYGVTIIDGEGKDGPVKIYLCVIPRRRLKSVLEMIKDHYAYIIMDKAYLAIIPGFAIMSLVLAFMLLGNGLRDAFDVKN